MTKVPIPETRKAGLIPYFVNDTIEFLLVIPSDPFYGGNMPQISKGYIDLGESPDEAAIREAEEELGLNINNIDDFQYCFDVKIKNYTLSIFMAKILNKKNFNEPCYETKETKWIKINNINEKTVREDHIPILKKCIEYLQ